MPGKMARKPHCEGDGISQRAGLPQRRRIVRQDAVANLTRWTIGLAGRANRAKREQIDDLPSEMPRFDERLAGVLPIHDGAIIGIELSSVRPWLTDLGHELVFVDCDAKAWLRR